MKFLHPDFPFAPRRWPFFYGWAIVAACTMGVIASVPGQTIGVGAFTSRLMEALGMSRTELSTAYMLGTLTSSVLLIYAGSLLDRWGARAMVVFSAVGLGVSLAGLAAAPHAAVLFPSAVVMFVCFLGLRFFGQGCLTLTSKVTVGKWFNHRRGVAAALTTVFAAFFFNGAPLYLNSLIVYFGWRLAALILAALIGIGMSFIGWLFYRDTPEECGLEMDGPLHEDTRRRLARRVPETHRDFTRGEAVRTLSFWAFNLGISCQSLVITAVTFHIAAIGSESGLSENQTFAIFLPTAFVAIPTTLLGGWLSDRIRLKWLLLTFMAAQAVYLTGLMGLASPTGRVLFTLGYGLSGGLFNLLVTVTWPRYYGRSHLGAVSGLNMSSMVLASALGPVLWSLGRDVTGNFQAIIAVSWLMPVAGIILALFAENPQRRYAP